MTSDRNAFRAGLFIIASLVAIVAVIVGIKGFSRIIEPAQHPAVAFKLSDNVGGLNLGDDVRAGGYKIGVVRKISLTNPTPPEEPKVIIEFSIPARYVLHADAHIGIDGTLTGTSWLNINTFGSGDPQPEGTPLVGHPSDLSILLARLEEIAPGFRDVLHDVRTATLPKVNDAFTKAGDTMTTFNQTGHTATEFVTHLSGKIDPVADRAEQAMAQIRDLVGDSKTDIRGTVAHLNSITGQIDQKLPNYLTRLDTMLAKINTALDTAQSSLADIKETMVNARSIVAGNKSRIDAIVTGLKATSDNLKFASIEIRRSPWRLLYKPEANEMANLNLYDSARQFAEGANDLNDAVANLRDALKDPGADKSQIQKLMEKLDSTFKSFSDVEQKLWKSVKN